jgi:hypothetical protein
MSPPEVLESPRDVPLGGHAISFHASPEEAAEHAISFLEGTPSGQSAMYWVANAAAADRHAVVAQQRVPQHVGCVAILATEQVEETEGKLRPVGEVRRFVSEHPEGVSAGADTLSDYWTRDTMSRHLEYEAWFDEQPREGSRFICPYALDRVPPDMAPRVLRELGSVHSHVILSESDEPGVRLLQLFIFDRVSGIPERLEAELGWAVRLGLVRVEPDTSALSLTHAGDQVVAAWARGDRAVP